MTRLYFSKALLIDKTGLSDGQCIERTLWCAVLLLCLEDLAVPMTVRPFRTSQKHSRYRMAEYRWMARNAVPLSARKFAFESRRWRATVCDMAGVDEECFVKRCEEIVEATRAAA